MNSIVLDNVLDTILYDWNIPGAAIGISDKTGILFEKYFGVQDIDSDIEINKDTRFCIASIGKLFVSVAIMHLYEAKKLDLYDYVTKYIPYFTFRDDLYNKITIEMLLSHRSGLPDLSMEEYMHLLDHPQMSMSEYIRMFSEHRLTEPGTAFKYSNFGYSILSEIISIITNMPFRKYMKEVIFKKLDMVNSSFELPEDFSDIAYAHLRVPNIIKSERYPYSDVDAPASFMHTTLHDMLKFYNNIEKVISLNSFNNMIKPRSYRGYLPYYESTGLGINIGHLENEVVVSHGGMGFGFSCFFMIFPEKGISAVVLCNEESFAHDKLYYAVGDLIVGKEPKAGKVSWIIPLAEEYLGKGKQGILNKAKSIIDNTESEYSADPDDIMNLIYQMIVGKKRIALKDFLEIFMELYPEDEESKELYELFIRQKQEAL